MTGFKTSEVPHAKSLSGTLCLVSNVDIVQERDSSDLAETSDS